MILEIDFVRFNCVECRAFLAKQSKQFNNLQLYDLWLESIKKARPLSFLPS